MTAVRTRARRTTLARWGGPLALAATLAIAALAYFATRPAPVQPLPPIVHQPTPVAPTQSLAALRTLNRDATPETLRLPGLQSGKSGVASSDAPLQPRFSRDPESMANLLGTPR